MIIPCISMNLQKKLQPNYVELKALSNQRIYANTELQGLQPIKPIATTKITKALPFSKIVHAAPVFVSATIKSEYRKEK